MSIDTIKKPDDWGNNKREQLLTMVNELCDNFLESPSDVNKERLIAITTFDEPTRHTDYGTVRFSEYESVMFNDIYFKFKAINFQYGISFLYNVLYRSAQLLKIINMTPYSNVDINECYNYLLPFLKYFFVVCYLYHSEKNRTFVDEMINVMDNIEKVNCNNYSNLVHSFNSVLYDLSGKCNNHVFKEFDFSRNEIKKLLLKSSYLMKKAGFRQLDRPHKGVLCMTIANYVLRSRNNYKFGNIFKCVSRNTVNSSFENRELWMRRRTKLNDKREGKVVREIFSNRSWMKYEWARSMKFTYERESFTCSFSTKIPSEKQKKTYGSYVYGYHNDIVGPSITTLVKKTNKEKKMIAAFSQYIMYDVLYSRSEFKKEINYLCSLIDGFHASDSDKKAFLEEIIDYWKMTIKDKRWEYENERRYEIMYFDEYEYAECSIDDTYLKNKTPLLQFPDFIVGENPFKSTLRRNAISKARYKNFGEPSVLCEECLFETSLPLRNEECPICKSKELTAINDTPVKKRGGS